MSEYEKLLSAYARLEKDFDSIYYAYQELLQDFNFLQEENKYLRRTNNRLQDELNGREDIQVLLDEMLTILTNNCIDSIYDSISSDEHELLWSKNGVEIHEAVGYGYADIIGLSAFDFNRLKTQLREVI